MRISDFGIRNEKPRGSEQQKAESSTVVTNGIVECGMKTREVEKLKG
jgi:hypothetical protein